MQADAESTNEKAIRLLKRQLEELGTVRALSYKDPRFKSWRDTTTRVLERFLGPTSPHTIRVRDTHFVTLIIRTNPWGGGMPDNYISPEDAQQFQDACEVVEASLKAAIQDVEDFGVHVEQPQSATRRGGRGRSGGVRQTFHGPVTFHNQAIATECDSKH
jgi:hypothetical protein